MIRISFIFFSIFFIVIPFIGIQFFLKFTYLPIGNKLPAIIHSLILRILSIKINIKGDISKKTPTLFISNHLSWIDILVLGSVVRARFIAKSEISTWPIFGFLSKLQNTIFVKREARSKVKNQQNIIQYNLSKKQNIILFPEGTTNDGNHILLFKSSLMETAKPFDTIKPILQMVIIRYTTHYGLPIGRYEMPHLAWYGDMELLEHLKQIYKMGPIKVNLSFEKEIYYNDFRSRKHLSHFIENAIRNHYVT